MRYELLLQSRGPEAPFEPSRLDALLLARGAKRAEGGAFLLALEHGTVELRPLMEGGRQVATELHVPLHINDALLRDALREGGTLAEEAELMLVDPQLLRPVSERDQDQVAAQFAKTAHYAGNILGVVDALPASYGAPPAGMKPATKVMLGIGAFLVVLYFVVDALIQQIH